MARLHLVYTPHMTVATRNFGALPDATKASRLSRLSRSATDWLSVAMYQSPEARHSHPTHTHPSTVLHPRPTISTIPNPHLTPTPPQPLPHHIQATPNSLRTQATPSHSGGRCGAPARSLLAPHRHPIESPPPHTHHSHNNDNHASSAHTLHPPLPAEIRRALLR